MKRRLANEIHYSIEKPNGQATPIYNGMNALGALWPKQAHAHAHACASS